MRTDYPLSAPYARVVSIGAYDRFNYGDLLFPLVLDYAAKELGFAPLIHATLRRSDQSAAGAVPTGPIRELLSAANQGAMSIVLGGGEVVGATWGPAAASVLPIPADLGLLAIRRLVSARFADFLGKAYLRGSWPTPYVPSRQSLVSRSLIVSAVGANSLEALRSPERASVVEALRAAAFLSVRDRPSQLALAHYGLAAEMSPDSVAVLPRVYHPALATDEPGLVIQGSRAWLNRQGPRLAESIRSLCGGFDSVTLVPIGLAGGHGDLQGLTRLRSALVEAGVSQLHLLRPRTIWDIADTIRNAKLFVGTSLHGAITAMAYAVPFVPLRGISKLDAYVSTWAAELAPRSAGPADLLEAARAALNVPLDLRRERSDELAERAWVNLGRVLEIANQFGAIDSGGSGPRP